ncbi:NADH-quinone oxidoreductase subunit J [Roseibacillus persicicus]|uniref:NADH-quinone oxidoreductase subunit J family protein n=1 Tax=Roseibacillus persicicus TaxID=454148 RepID=UPI00398ABB11
MPQVLFYLFSVLAVLSACLMVIVKNPVSSALWMVGAFVGMAALFVGLNAYFVGIIQILVYAGAIMVLFVFIIMLLDLKAEEKRVWKPANIAAGAVVPTILLLQILGVLLKSDFEPFQELDLKSAATAHQQASLDLYQEKAKKAGEEFDPADVPVGKIQANLEDNQLPDVHLVGRTVFAGRADKAASQSFGFDDTSNNLPLQVMGVLLVVATIGVVVLSKKGSPAKSN